MDYHYKGIEHYVQAKEAAKTKGGKTHGTIHETAATHDHRQ